MNSVRYEEVVVVFSSRLKLNRNVKPGERAKHSLDSVYFAPTIPRVTSNCCLTALLVASRSISRIGILCVDTIKENTPFRLLTAYSSVTTPAFLID